MIPDLIIGVRMDQRTERTAIDYQPRYEGAELFGREDVDFEHGYGMWADRFVPDFVDP